MSLPSPARWVEICEALDLLEGAALTAALEAAQEEVQAWPDALRVVPARWCHDLLEGRSQVRLALARHLKLNLNDWSVNLLRSLLRHPALRGVVEVTLRRLRRRALDWVAALLPMAERLRALTLDDFQLHHLHLRRLFGGRVAWPALERLVMTSSGLDLAGVEVLCAGGLPQTLRVLGLSRTRMDGAALHALLGVPWPALQSLDLSGNDLGDDAVQSLVDARLPSLRELFLVQSGLTDQGWRQLQSAPWRATLARLAGEPALIALDTLSGGLPALRAALYHGISAETWAEICEVVDLWPAGQDWAVGRAYAQDHLSSWPDRLRTVPVRWLRHAAQERTLPHGWALARTLTVHAWAGLAEVLPQLLTPEGVGHLRRLNLERVAVDEAVLADLAEATALDALRHFGLMRCEFKGVENVGRSLHEASWWHGLQSLALTGCHHLIAPQEGAWRLPRDLQVLDLTGCLYGGFKFAGMFGGPLPEGLRTLSLARSSLGLRGVQALSEAPALRSLRTLDLSENKLLGTAWKPLMESFFWPALEEMILARCALSQTLADLRHAPVSALRTLNLSHNRIGERNLGILMSLRCFPHLTSLELEACGLNARAGKLLSYGSWSSSLRRLNVSYNLLGAKGVAALTQAPLPALSELDLSGNSLGRAGLARLTLAPWWRQLSSLRLDCNGLDEACVPLLMSLREAEQMEMLSLRGNCLELKGIQRLREALPHLKVTTGTA